jgi:lipopolysaccharide transport system ATP-binding protein
VVSPPIIAVENLGKKYRLDHRGERQRYTTLRDVLAARVKQLFGHGDLKRPGNTIGHKEEFWALKGVSFEIKQGEVLGIIGRNGAGKSTLLKILSRITEPSAGRVRIRGRVASLLEVGTGFHPELTGRENIFLNGAILGMARAEILRKFDEIVAFAEVEKFLDTPVKRYSSGMYVRLAFAVAAHLEPEILVVDEVLAVGDAEFQKKCLGKMQDASKGGRTVLFVSHNMGAVQSLCDVGMLLDRGEMRTIGPVGRVVSDYLTGLRSGAGADGVVDLGPSLQLGRLKIQPDSLRSGGPLSLDIQLVPVAATTVKELALLIYSDQGVRVAIMDLRRLCGATVDRVPFEFEVHVEKLPMVEGDYSLGFYVATKDHHANILDVATLHIGAAQRAGDVVPYPARDRGFIELEFTARKKVERPLAIASLAL